MNFWYLILHAWGGRHRENISTLKMVRWGLTYHLNKGRGGRMVTTYRRVSDFQEKIEEPLKEQMGEMILLGKVCLGVVTACSLLSCNKGQSSGWFDDNCVSFGGAVFRPVLSLNLLFFKWLQLRIIHVPKRHLLGWVPCTPSVVKDVCAKSNTSFLSISSGCLANGGFLRKRKRLKLCGASEEELFCSTRTYQSHRGLCPGLLGLSPSQNAKRVPYIQQGTQGVTSEMASFFCNDLLIFKINWDLFGLKYSWRWLRFKRKHGLYWLNDQWPT